MPLQNSQYEEIMRLYSRRQNRNHRILEERRAALFQRIPRLREIDALIASSGAAAARAVLTDGVEAAEDLKKQVRALSLEQDRLLSQNGYPGDYLTLPCDCPLCRDTGYVDGRKCACFQKEELKLLYAGSGLSEALRGCSLKDFSLAYYSEEIREESTQTSAREMAANALRFADTFVESFGRSFKNLFLYGETGVGKTFLSHCIAGELIRRSVNVLYLSSFELFDELARSTFSGGGARFSSEWILDCDLLIIDDLGTELTNNFVTSQLFMIVNERLARRHPLIISTNLSLQNFTEIYSERVFSRIVGNFGICKLIGRDIRFQKKLTGGH